VVTVKEGSRIAKRWFPQISITVRSLEASLFVTGALAPLLLWCLLAVPVISHCAVAAGAVDALWVADAALLSALAGIAAYVAARLAHRRSQRRDHPDILLFYHLAMLAKKLLEIDHSRSGFTVQKDLCNRIEKSVLAVNAMARALGGSWRPEDEEIRQDFDSAASALMELKREVVFPKYPYTTTTDQPSVADQACVLCMICATGLYGRLPRAGTRNSDKGRTRSRYSRISVTVKRVLAALVPLAFFLLIQAFPLLPKFTHFPAQDLVTLGLAAILWPLIYIIKFLDPNYSDTLSSLKDTLSLGAAG
jgi:hypothetical protein